MTELSFNNQEERLEYLLHTLSRELGTPQKIVPGKMDRRFLLRALMNIREPIPISDEFLKVQDDYLRQEAAEKGIVPVMELPTIRVQYGQEGENADRISIWQGDITRLAADAIVNAANSRLLGCFAPCHGCIDNAIHSAAGLELRQECFELMKAQGHDEPTGLAKITCGYNLPCKYVLHTVGPIVAGAPSVRDRTLLKSCYESCLSLAEQRELKSLVFCCISTGEFHFPNRPAAEIAVETVNNWLCHSRIERVVLNVYKDHDLEIYEDLVSKTLF